MFSHRGSTSKQVEKVRNGLADLIENRIPAELAADTAKPERSRLNVLSLHYRIVVSCREDYLPDLKSWEKDVPSLLRNYLRLEPMTRQCAIATVEASGKTVLGEGVAPLIVEFVGKIDEGANRNTEAVIEPVLLCLCCYQLNRRRKDGEKISKELVARAGRDILDNFYQTALSDKDVKGPPDVPTFIETYLVQGDRFRGAYPKAEAIDEGLLTQTQLDALTDRHRLLRVVQHADTARVELIHDRMVEVVCRARNDRRIRERQAERERQAARQFQRRLRIAGAVIAVAVLALGLISLLLIANEQFALATKQLNDELKGLNEQAEQLNKQFRFFRLQAEATATPPDGLPRDLVEDREVYATLQIGLAMAALDMAVGAAVDTLRGAHRPTPRAGQQPPAPQIPEATRVYRTSLSQLDRSTRSILSDVSVKIVDNASANPELAALDAAPADCAVTDPEMEVRYLVADEPGSLGLALRAELSEGVRIINMRPIRRVSSDEFRELESSNLRGRRLEPGVLVCLSKDANWFLLWRPLPENQVAEPPVIQRIQWIRTARQSSGDDDWHAELKDGRLPQTRQMWANVVTLSREYQRLNSAVRDGGRVIDSFRSGSRAGFTIALGENKAALLWTSTGLVDPEAVETALPHKLVLCEFDQPTTRTQTGALTAVSRCEMGPVSFDGIDHFLTADYLGCLRPETPAVCETEISLHYNPLDPVRSSARVAFRLSSSRIVAAAVWDDSLWIKDTNGQVWRYLVGMKALQNLLVERWKGIGDPAKMAKASYSDSCKQLNCDKVRVPGWPGQ